MLKQQNGLIYKDLCIDPHKSPKTEKVLLSHAHADHVKLSKDSEFFATPETIAIVKKRFARKNKTNFSQIEFGKEKKFDDFSLILKPNGHVLGSSQINISTPEKNISITSDFRFQDSLLFKGLIPSHADTLVLETTFGSPSYVFPKQEDVTNEMISFVEKEARTKLVLLSGYSLGKAQELTKISNDAGFTPLVHDSIFEMNEIYKDFGVDLGKYERLDHNLKDFSVLIMPPQLVDRFLLATLREFDSRKIVSALATGWTYARGFDKLFPLSNHADYNDLLEFVKLSEPRLVLTDHGFCEEFARKLNRLGFNAKPLKQHNQRIIGEY